MYVQIYPQELLEARWTSLGMKKNCNGDLKSDNKRNGSSKHSKAGMGNSGSMFPVTAMVSLNQS